MTQGYGKICAEFYDADKPWAELAEVDFFVRHLKNATGPALEAMCGSGRLLIPLMQRGFFPEGCDTSPAMLARLQARCEKKRLPIPIIYEQSITSLALPRRYGLIFIVLGSIQLLPRHEISRALNQLRIHLLPGGKLILDTFIPWDLVECSQKKKLTKRSLASANTRIGLTSQILVDKDEQFYAVKNDYFRNDHGVIVETEAENFQVQWYFPEQFLTELDRAGFVGSPLVVPAAATQPRRIVYEAARKE